MVKNLNFLHRIIGDMEMVRRGWFEIYLEVGLTTGLNLEDEAKRGIKGVTFRVLT